MEKKLKSGPTFQLRLKKVGKLSLQDNDSGPRGPGVLWPRVVLTRARQQIRKKNLVIRWVGKLDRSELESPNQTSSIDKEKSATNSIRTKKTIQRKKSPRIVHTEEKTTADRKTKKLNRESKKCPNLYQEGGGGEDLRREGRRRPGTSFWGGGT